jgi:hypothetical protein
MDQLQPLTGGAEDGLVELPETRYAKTADGVHIAYQVIGNGPIDLLLVCWLLNVEHIWRWPIGGLVPAETRYVLAADPFRPPGNGALGSRHRQGQAALP